jgi:hypothetical protein
MSEKTTWRCICCGKDLGESPQNGAVVLHSHGGNWGSTSYDCVAGGQPDYIQGGLCDSCFVVKIQDKSLRSFMTRRVDPPPYEVDWDPKRDDNLLDPDVDWSGDE